jgi:hypothetical protein
MGLIAENHQADTADFGMRQRWRNGRASYRPAGEPFDHSRATVEAIDEATAKAFVVREHYSHSYPAARFRACLFVKQPFKKEVLLGVGVFSVPMNQRVIGAYFDGLEPGNGVELGRFCLLDEAAANAESWSLARMKQLLKKALPAVQGVIAYCDPIERRHSDGTVVKRGHVGTIYKATNSHYRGRSSARTLWLAPPGECLVDRMLSKIRSGDVGAAYAMDHLRKLGAPARALREPGDDYLRRLRETGWMRPVRHPGNLAFTWVLP